MWVIPQLVKKNVCAILYNMYICVSQKGVKMKRHLYFLALPFLLAGCNTNIFPQSDGTFYSVTNSAYESSAESNALSIVPLLV
jgi:hypothetical protein